MASTTDCVYLIIYIPFIIPDLVMIPTCWIAYIYDAIERKFPKIWRFLFTIITMGGLANGLSDIMLIVESLISFIHYLRYNVPMGASFISFRLIISIVGSLLASILFRMVFQKKITSKFIYFLVSSTVFKPTSIIFKLIYYIRVIRQGIKNKQLSSSFDSNIIREEKNSNDLLQVPPFLDFVYISFPLSIITLVECSRNSFTWGGGNFWKMFKLVSFGFEFINSLHVGFFVMPSHDPSFFFGGSPRPTFSSTSSSNQPKDKEPLLNEEGGGVPDLNQEYYYTLA
ncbi:hypothetical protein DFA_08895 [Cavenderia fasciculata]|uniref:Transmembrane protein n=1 Tax=Cavenderia fasciculata TaxID=261658 RepID=F4Q4U8_CACFS|nr:uncharacterized protein DFA_08895 [Cavenderia fasciculata]EGG17894.1 hypothetical protein DFA_08895 [Cavenderia fasciculata]|eukprot:XP_004356378.1 hypothetical protein DFA_08895 [Cavenderia fasciculata]